MNATLGRILSLLARGSRGSVPMLDGFLDGLLQGFENCRPGLADRLLEADAEGAVRFFFDLYEKERPRLLETIRSEEPHLTDEARAEYARRVDGLIRDVVIPAYLRVALRFTRRERNQFFLVPEPWHGLERVGWAVAGIALGGFVVLAPFIPLTAKEWVLPFFLAGLVFPTLRRTLALRSYEAELNGVVARADAEIARIDTAYLTSGEPLASRGEEIARSTPQAETLRGGS